MTTTMTTTSTTTMNHHRTTSARTRTSQVLRAIAIVLLVVVSVQWVCLIAAVRLQWYHHNWIEHTTSRYDNPQSPRANHP